MEGFSRDMAELRPERTMAGHVRAMHSQSCRLAKHTPLWLPRRQYKAPWRSTENRHNCFSPAHGNNADLVGLRKRSYFELLLRHAAIVWVQELEDVRNQVSAAEVVGSQSAEQNILSPASNLTRDVDEHQGEFVLNVWMC